MGIKGHATGQPKQIGRASLQTNKMHTPDSSSQFHQCALAHLLVLVLCAVAPELADEHWVALVSRQPCLPLTARLRRSAHPECGACVHSFQIEGTVVEWGPQPCSRTCNPASAASAAHAHAHTAPAPQTRSSSMSASCPFARWPNPSQRRPCPLVPPLTRSVPMPWQAACAVRGRVAHADLAAPQA